MGSGTVSGAHGSTTTQNFDQPSVSGVEVAAALLKAGCTCLFNRFVLSMFQSMALASSKLTLSYLSLATLIYAVGVLLGLPLVSARATGLQLRWDISRDEAKKARRL